jgi:hypothetical protein
VGGWRGAEGRGCENGREILLQVELDGAKTRLAAQHAQIQLLQTQLEEGQYVTVPSLDVTVPSHCAPFDESAPLVAQVLVGG